MVKGGFEAKIRELQTSHRGDIYRGNLAFTARELDRNLATVDSSVSRYLVVGYTFREDDPVYVNNKTFARYSENELVGESRPPPQYIITWAEIMTPILVVTPVKENTGTSIRLFGLVMPRSGLCQPVLLTHERIFYRWEYRASAGARSTQRNKNWNQIIIDKAFSISLATAGPNAPRPEPITKRREPREPAARTEDGDTFYLDPNGRRPSETGTLELNLDLDALFEPLSNVYGVISTVQDLTSPSVTTCLQIALHNGEIRGLVQAIRKARNDRIRHEVELRLHCAKQMKGKLPDEYDALKKFADSGDSNFDMELAYQVFVNIKTLWPQLGQLAKPNHLMRIKHVINRNQQSLSNECFEYVLRTLLSALTFNDKIPPEVLQGRLREAIYSSQAMQKPASRSDDVPENGPLSADAKFLVTLLKEAMAIHEWQTRAVPHLSRNVPASFQGHIYEHVIDIQNSQLNPDDARETIRWLLNHAQSRSCDIDDVLLWLERLRLRIRSA